MTASTPSIQPLLTQNLNLRCAVEETSPSSTLIGRSVVSPSSSGHSHLTSSSSAETKSRSMSSVSPGNAKFVTSMFIYKDDADIASVSEHINAQHIGNATNIDVSGGITGDRDVKGSLEVNITYPTESQVGNFTCQISATDDVGHPVIYSVSVEVTVAAPTINDLVQHIHTQALADQKNNAEIAKNKAEIAGLKSKVASLESDLDEATHFESGTVGIGNLGTVGGAHQSRSISVSFKKTYKSTPTVLLATQEAGINKDYHAYYEVKLTHVDTDGFTVTGNIQHSDYYLGYVHVSWFAYP